MPTTFSMRSNGACPPSGGNQTGFGVWAPCAFPFRLIHIGRCVMLSIVQARERGYRKQMAAARVKGTSTQPRPPTRTSTWCAGRQEVDRRARAIGLSALKFFVLMQALFAIHAHSPLSRADDSPRSMA